MNIPVVLITSVSFMAVEYILRSIIQTSLLPFCLFNVGHCRENDAVLAYSSIRYSWLSDWVVLQTHVCI